MVSPFTTTIIILSVALFHAGLLIGWFISRDSDVTNRAKLKTLVAVVITLGWIAATVAGILITTYTVSPMLHALMGAIVGYFFTDDGISLNVGTER